MTAVVKRVEFMGKVGVGVFINGGFSTFIVTAVNLLYEIQELKMIGYEVKLDNIDGSELEDEMALLV